MDGKCGLAIRLHLLLLVVVSPFLVLTSPFRVRGLVGILDQVALELLPSALVAGTFDRMLVLTLLPLVVLGAWHTSPRFNVYTALHHTAAVGDAESRSQEIVSHSG